MVRWDFMSKAIMGGLKDQEREEKAALATRKGRVSVQEQSHM